MNKKTITNFKYNGNISFWEIVENRNYPQWNMTCNEAGRTSLLSLLNLMLKDNFSTKVTLDNTSPIALGQEWIEALPNTRSYSKLTIHHNRDSPIANIQVIENNVILNISTDKLEVLSRHILDNSFDISMTLADKVYLGFW